MTASLCEVPRDGGYFNACHICGIPADADFFDSSNVFQIDQSRATGPSLNQGEEIVLAKYELHRNYCGVLMYFAQFTDPMSVRTPGYEWQIRCNGQPRAPYLTFGHIVNPWGMAGFPIGLRLEEGCLLELVIRKVNAPVSTLGLNQVGGRIVGRYWYNTIYGGAPNRL